MPSWKKVITSGSSAALSSLTVTGGITGSLFGTASYTTSASYALNGGVTQIIAGTNVNISPTNGLGNVTISSFGSNLYNTATGSYGSFYDTTTQTNPVANVPRSMSIDTTDISNGVSISGSTNPYNTYIKVANAGVYNIEFSAQFDRTNSGTDTVYIWLRKNGVDIPNSNTSIILTGGVAASATVAAWNWFVNASAGDYYQIMWESGDTHVRLLSEPSPTYGPSLPSIILTAQRVDTFLSNTGSFSGSFTGIFTGSLFGTASWALNALTSSNVQGGTANYIPIWNTATSLSSSAIYQSAGNVGIGTTSPSAKLHVDGNMYLQNSATSIDTITFSNGPQIEANGPASYFKSGEVYTNPVTSKVGIGTSTPTSASLTVNGNVWATSFTGSLFGTASWATNASTASFVTTAQTASFVTASNVYGPFGSNSIVSASFAVSSSRAVTSSFATTSSYSNTSISASFASTASYVNTLNQNVLITGSLTVASTTAGASENTLTLGPSPAGGTGEGGQLGLNAVGGTYTSASFIDNWQNKFRILKGTNASSTGLIAQWDIHTTQLQLPAYTSPTAITGTVSGLLAFDTSGNIITTTTGSGGGGGVTINNNVDNYIVTATGTANTLNGESGLQYNGTSLAVTGQVTASGAIISTANGAMYFRGGDDAEFWDINVANTVGIYGQQNADRAGLKLGSSGPTLFGSASRFGIGTITPTLATLEVNGNVWANSFTGSLQGTASVASNVLLTVQDSTPVDYNLVFTGLSTTGNGSLNIDTTTLKYNPSTTTLSTGTVVANLTGTASWANNATTATNANNVAVTDTTTGTGPYYLMFADGTTGNRAVRVDSSTLQFNATTNTLTVPNLAGTASWASNATTATSANTLTNTRTIWGQNFNGSANVTGNLTSVGTITGTSAVDLDIIAGNNARITLMNPGVDAVRFGTSNTVRWSVDGSNGNFISNGAQTIATNTGNLTLATNAGNGNILLTPNGTGSIGIGTTTPNARLDVNGNAIITGSFTVVTGSAREFQVRSTGVDIGSVITDTHTVTGSLNISGSVTATSFTGSLLGTSSLANYANSTDVQNTNVTYTTNHVPMFTQGVTLNNYSSDGQVFATVIQTDGKILVGGSFEYLNGNVRRYLVRLNPDGTEDTAFNTVYGSGFNSYVTSIALQSDGKILVGGEFTSINLTTRNRLVRLNSDGTVDTSFSTNLGTGFDNVIYSIAVQSDGKILVGGYFNTLNGTIRNYFVRLNSDGTVDTSFYTNLGTGFNSIVYSIAVQSDGKILVGGNFSTLNGTTRNRLVRLNSDGTVDTSFYTNLGTGFNQRPTSIAVQSDGKILAGGYFTTLNGTSRNYLVRLNSTGTVDTSFYSNLGSAFNSFVQTVTLQSDGKILVGGYFDSLNGSLRNRLVRLNSDGTQDTAFYTNLNGGFSNGPVWATAVQSDGKVLVGGSQSILSNNQSLKSFVRLTSSGSIDPTDYITSTTTKVSPIYVNGTNVGINTTAPTNSLTVAGTADIAGDLIVSGQYVSSYQGYLSALDTNVTVFQYNPNNYYAAMLDIHIRLDDGSFKLMQINIASDTNGNYTYTEQSTSEIGNTSPVTFNIIFDSGDNVIKLRGTNTSSVNDAPLRMFVRMIKA